MADASSWHQELAGLLDDTGTAPAGAPYTSDAFNLSTTYVPKSTDYFHRGNDDGGNAIESESYRKQAEEFARAWCEMMWELGKGFKDIARQNFVTDDSFVVRKVGRPCAEVVSGRLRLLNEYLPEDKDPAQAWPVILLVLLLALLALCVNKADDCIDPHEKAVQIHPPSALRIVLPDARHLAYNEQGVQADKARFTVIAPHAFLFSRIAGIPGVKSSTLEEFGIRLVSYDLPGFGESDPHPARNLNTSAFDMLYLANAVGVSEKFWLLCFSSACIHTWAAINYIPDRVAGAAFFAPMINPYDPRMNKEESHKIWGQWVYGRKLIYRLGRIFPKFLSFIFQRKYFSGRHGSIDDWLYLSLSAKDAALMQNPKFEEFWHRNVEESVRQGNINPFVEEIVLQTSNWGFSLANLQAQKKCLHKGILPWLKSIYSQPECELTGFLSPLHLWRGMDDEVIPPAVTDYIARLLPHATIHSLPGEGHFSFLFFCDECHKQIFSTLFGVPQGPPEDKVEGDSVEESVPVGLS